MPKRQNNQHTIGNMVHYGKPVVVPIETLAPDADGQMTRYIETFDGFASGSDDDLIKSAPDRGDYHPGHCKNRLGVAKTWTRDARTWCLGCYRMRYGRMPTNEELTAARKPREQPTRKVSRRDFGL